MSVLDDALRFAELGFHILPVHHKSPQLKKWPDLATNDKQTIIDWYSKQYSYCDGFGVCPAKTCVILDIDVKDGKKGIESLKVLRDNHGLDLKTFAVRSKSGGLHLYYAYPNPNKYIKSIVNWTIPGVGELNGIDIRGTRGFVVGPTELNGYKLFQDIVPIGLPDELARYLPYAEDTRSTTKVSPRQAEVLVTEEGQQLRGNIPERIGLGERHDTLIRLMASWARKVHYEQAVILLQEAIRRCEQSEDDYITLEDYIGRLDESYEKFDPVIEDRLEWMLDNLVLINNGNRVFNRSLPPNSALLKFHESKTLYANWINWEEKTSPSGGKTQKPVPVFNEWVRHPKRQSMTNIGYKPINVWSYRCPVLGQEVVNGYRGPIHIKPDEIPEIEPFLEFMTYLCGEENKVMMDWMAHLVQQPHQKLAWAPVLVSVHEGMGKNFLFDIISQLLGRWNTRNITAGLFNKTFNTFLIQSVLVLINELEEVDNRRRIEIVSKLKSYITEREQTIEAKGIDAYTTEVYSNFILFSNREDALHIDDDSRRFMVHISYADPRPATYFRHLYGWLLRGGYYAIYQYLKHRDITDFECQGRAPETYSKKVMVEASRSQEENETILAIQNNASIFRSDIVTHDSWHHYIRYILHNGHKMTSAHQKQLFRKLFKSVKQTNGKPTRQMTLKSIGTGSDKFVILPGPSIKDSVWTCRNHGKYNALSNDEIRSEYAKIFDVKASEDGERKPELNLVQ